MSADRKMIISPAWLLTAVLTFVAGFAVLIWLAAVMERNRPPVPERVTGPDGRILFARDNVEAGQHVFQKYVLMQYGTIFGHGAYLGPDFTAQYLHEASGAMLDFYAKEHFKPGEAESRVRADFKTNEFDAITGTLHFTAAQAAAFDKLEDFYRGWFGAHETQAGLKRPHISDPAELHNLTAYFSWATWVTTAQRPARTYSYTNNWPPEPLADNYLTADAVLWSVLSLMALLGGVGLVMYLFGRYNVLGWHGSAEEEGRRLKFRPPEEVRLTPSQRATAWYFLVVAGLFLFQGLLGGLNAHYHVEQGSFYGFDVSKVLPYNLSRMWHVQLALFFVASAFLAMGIFIAPLIARREPKHQDKLAVALFGALVLVVVGSLLGEAASVWNWFSLSGPWFWIGSQGWEYLDLGRLWQILLVVGMALWLVILIRGLASRLRHEHPGEMPWLFMYSAITIPLFYAAGLMYGKTSEYVVVDYWRFWVVHLWVEDFLELFTTIMVAYIFVLLGVVRQTTATRVIYLDVILYSIGGVIGTMHHLYFSGTPAVHMALGAFFSAMEVIPLVLLTYEAWRFMQLGGSSRGVSAFGTPPETFPHKWAVLFLIAVGFWNFVGAGIFGFLINLPVVSYFQIGTAFTANHGHGALMGVYGMLAIGFFMFVARYFIPPDRRSNAAMAISFWGLNIGLGLMIFVNLVPMGIMQLYDSALYGYWHAREAAFYAQPAVRVIEWLRIVGDAIFIVLGILPVVYLAIRMVVERKRYGQVPPEAPPESFVLVYEHEGDAGGA